MPDDETIYRHIVNVLLAEHDKRGLPDINLYPPRVLACAWGLYSYIHRLAKAATILADSGFEFEVIAIARIVLEHTIVLHWIVERGDEGVDALLAKQSRQMKRFLDTAKGTELEVPPPLFSQIDQSFTGIDEAKALQDFRTICNQVDAQSLYAVYGTLSNFVHPTTTTSNMFATESELRVVPQGDHSATMSLITHCLIWAERDFDSLTSDRPREADLEALAQSINARPVLPRYHSTAATQRKRSKKGQRGRKGR